MSLHLVFNSAGYAACRQRKLSDDPIILLGDGVYCANRLDEDNIHVLEIDARGFVEHVSCEFSNLS